MICLSWNVRGMMEQSKNIWFEMRLLYVPGSMEYHISFVCKKLRFLTSYCAIPILFYDMVASFLPLIILLVVGGSSFFWQHVGKSIWLLDMWILSIKPSRCCLKSKEYPLGLLMFMLPIMPMIDAVYGSGVLFCFHLSCGSCVDISTWLKRLFTRWVTFLCNG